MFTPSPKARSKAKSRVSRHDLEPPLRPANICQFDLDSSSFSPSKFSATDIPDIPVYSRSRNSIVRHRRVSSQPSGYTAPVSPTLQSRVYSPLPPCPPEKTKPADLDWPAGSNETLSVVHTPVSLEGGVGSQRDSTEPQTPTNQKRVSMRPTMTRPAWAKLKTKVSTNATPPPKEKEDLHATKEATPKSSTKHRSVQYTPPRQHKPVLAQVPQDRNASGSMYLPMDAKPQYGFGHFPPDKKSLPPSPPVHTNQDNTWWGTPAKQKRNSGSFSGSSGADFNLSAASCDSYSLSSVDLELPFEMSSYYGDEPSAKNPDFDNLFEDGSVPEAPPVPPKHQQRKFLDPSKSKRATSAMSYSSKLSFDYCLDLGADYDKSRFMIPKENRVLSNKNHTKEANRYSRVFI